MSSCRITNARPAPRRQLSASRVGKPPCAPPAQKLPPPPIDNSPLDDLFSFITPTDLVSPSSSILSFISSHCLEDDDSHLRPYSPVRSEVKEEHYGPIRNISSADTEKYLGRGRPPSFKSALSHADRYSLTRTLKKAASHQSFSSKHERIGSTSTPPEDEKHARKQRSFHHYRQHRNVNSQNSSKFSSLGSQIMIDPEEIEERTRGGRSGASTPTRRRLFSPASMRRPSTSQGEHREQDVRSVLSLPIEGEHTAVSSKPKSSAASSLHGFLQDELDTPGSSEYIPQQILSPADMLRVEASIEAGTDDWRRPRVPSSSTSSTYPSDMFNDFSFPSDPSPPSPSSIRPSLEHAFPSDENAKSPTQTSPRGSIAASKEKSSLRIRTRPLQGHFSSPASPSTSSPYTSPASPEYLVSLPPPPRPRQQSPLISYDQNNRLSVVPLVPLSPPPVRKKTLRSNSSLESVMLRRSIMKKPSFLEIEDEDKDSDLHLDGSFLDLNRESFDTLRSMPEPDGVSSQPLAL
jgi:hypothetical protein